MRNYTMKDFAMIANLNSPMTAKLENTINSYILDMMIEFELTYNVSFENENMAYYVLEVMEDHGVIRLCLCNTIDKTQTITRYFKRSDNEDEEQDDIPSDAELFSEEAYLKDLRSAVDIMRGASFEAPVELFTAALVDIVKNYTDDTQKAREILGKVYDLVGTVD